MYLGGHGMWRFGKLYNCTYMEPDKTYNTTIYVRPAKTQDSLCINPLYKASFLDSPESKEGAYCTISEESDRNVLLQSHCLSRFGQPGCRSYI